MDGFHFAPPWSLSVMLILLADALKAVELLLKLCNGCLISRVYAKKGFLEALAKDLEVFVATNCLSRILYEFVEVVFKQGSYFT